MDSKEDFFLDEETAEWVAQKKSEYLSKLILQMGDGDFGFEEFHQFDYLIPGTIGDPDRSYEDTSEDWPLRTCVKTYAESGNFHQVVVGAIIRDKNSKGDIFVPVLTFVTRKSEVVHEWTTGPTHSRHDLN